LRRLGGGWSAAVAGGGGRLRVGAGGGGAWGADARGAPC
jgi:hypothetical protein